MSITEIPRYHTIITWLERREPPTEPPAALPEGVLLLQVKQPDIVFYRYLHRAVGDPWLWWYRATVPDAEVERIIRDPRVEVWVLYADGQPAGFFELDRRESGEVELVYFGLVPRFIGRGLGGAMMRHAIARAFAEPIQRLWLHTCTLDSPRAIPFYESHGFRPYKSEVEIIDDPRATGVLPPDAGALCHDLEGARKRAELLRDE